MSDNLKNPLFATEMQEGYLMAIEESITSIFAKQLSLDEMEWVLDRVNKWYEYERRARLK